MLFVLPGDVCVDVTAQIKTQLKEWTWELARVAEGMKEWEVIFKVCPHSCPRLEKRQICYPARNFVKLYWFISYSKFQVSNCHRGSV